MKLVSFGARDNEQPGLLSEDGSAVLDLGIADSALPKTTRDLFSHNLIPSLRDRFGNRSDWPAHAVIDAASVRFGPPITNPTKIICLGMNYRDHAEEQNKQVPENPLLFSKGRNVLGGHNDPIPYPEETEKLDYEVELAVVIGRRVRGISQKEAMTAVGGYGVFLDITARDIQKNERQWFRGKSIDGCGPFGPYLATADEVPDPHALDIELTVNGETLQSSNTGRMIFRVDFVIHHIAKTMTLEPGDIIATGTPAGVGVFRDPPRFLQRGDQIAASITGLGTLECTIE